MSNSSYSHYVESIAQQFQQLAGNSTVSLTPLVKPEHLPANPRIAILSPHPDDECLMGACALRMKEEWGAEVGVVPFSYGSLLGRRAERANELKAALQVLGFSFLGNASLDRLTTESFAQTMDDFCPDILIAPHLKDRHPAHVEAAKMAQTWSGKATRIQTEYWQASEEPNWFVPLEARHVVTVGEALMKHAGEVSRNPYHLSLPGWFMDQARRAPELLGGGFGGKSSAIFGQLLRID